MVAMVRGGRSNGWSRRYPPLAVVIAALILAVFALPSALNLPQANPAQTLEYAPVPGDSNNAPPGGNIAGLGLGQGGTGTGNNGTGGNANLPGSPTQPPALNGAGNSPSSKQCVGNPPRQTEDPSSPPCVAFFTGDNGGATYQGVSPTEIRVIVYVEGGGTQLATSRGSETYPPPGSCDDLAAAKNSDFVWTRMVRLYSVYFNHRYQTYNRSIHFYVCYSSGVRPQTPTDRRTDAASQFANIHPFAALDQTANGNAAAYSEAMTQHGVLVFQGAQTERNPCCSDAAYFSRHPGLQWSVAASTEEYAPQFIDYVCKRIVNRVATFSGNVGDNGNPRKLGLIIEDRPGYPELKHYVDLVQSGIQRCGGKFEFTGTEDGNQQTPDHEAATVASFKQKGVSTIIWPGGPSQNSGDDSGLYTGNAAAALSYYPEVVIGGSGASDITFEGTLQNKAFWANVLISTEYPRADVLGEMPCFNTARESDPSAPSIDLENYGCPVYDGIRLIATGIQVAGPKLTPQTADQGFHAIPAVSSKDPHIPACFFSPGGYTCAKDSTAMYWDPKGQDPGSTSSKGCYRILEGGRRLLAGQWPAEDAMSHRSGSDPCNHQGITTS